QSGGTAALAAADIGDRGQALTSIREVSAALGPVDLLIANAGVGRPTFLDPMNVPDVEMMFRVNVLGMVYAFEAVLHDTLRRGRGILAGVSILGAYNGLRGESGYCASKMAVITCLESLRINLHGRGIPVTTICLGVVRPPMADSHAFHMPWLLEPD